jgi:glycine/D-amino acid oxidase-like deaminating enzyme
MREPDVIIVGAGLAGLVAAHELVEAGRTVLFVEQENRNNLGGQAFWSLGGLFMVDTPEQRRLGVRDSYELALQDWLGSAGFDRDRSRPDSPNSAQTPQPPNREQPQKPILSSPSERTAFRQVYPHRCPRGLACQ